MAPPRPAARLLATLARAVRAYGLSLILLPAGVLHLASPALYERLMPPWIAQPHFWVLFTGVCELAAACGLLVPRLQRVTGWCLVAFFIAVLPVNLHMALHDLPVFGRHMPLLLWLRVPFQALFIAWAWWFTRDPKESIRRATHSAS